MDCLLARIDFHIDFFMRRDENTQAGKNREQPQNIIELSGDEAPNWTDMWRRGWIVCARIGFHIHVLHVRG